MKPVNSRGEVLPEPKQHVLKVCMGTGVRFCTLQIYPLELGEWSGLISGRFTTGERMWWWNIRMSPPES